MRAYSLSTPVLCYVSLHSVERKRTKEKKAKKIPPTQSLSLSIIKRREGIFLWNQDERFFIAPCNTLGERLLYWTRWVYWTTPIFPSLLTWSAPINISTSDVVSVTRKNSIKMAEKDKILSRGLKIEISLNWSYLWLLKSVCCDYMKYMELIYVCFMWSLDILAIRYLTFIPNKIS